jgi:hypothetical protein
MTLKIINKLLQEISSKYMCYMQNSEAHFQEYII